MACYICLGINTGSFSAVCEDLFLQGVTLDSSVSSFVSVTKYNQGEIKHNTVFLFVEEYTALRRHRFTFGFKMTTTYE